MRNALSLFVIFVFTFFSVKVTASVYRDGVSQRLTEMNSIIPIVDNKEAQALIDLAFGRDRELTANLINRSFRYFPYIEYRLRKEGLPADLKYIAIIESELYLKVQSGVGAAGLWQLMPPIAQEMGLEINKDLDERLDPIKSTDAAISYLKDMYSIFEDWSLVMVAYNCGPYRLKRIIRERGTTDITRLVNHLPDESQRFLTKFSAINYVFNFYRNHGLEIPSTKKSTRHVTVAQTFPKGLSISRISKQTGLPLNYIRSLNPHILSTRNEDFPTGVNLILPLGFEVDGANIKKHEVIVREYIIDEMHNIEDIADLAGYPAEFLRLWNSNIDPSISYSSRLRNIKLYLPENRYLVLDQTIINSGIDKLPSIQSRVSYTPKIPAAAVESENLSPLHHVHSFRHVLRPHESIALVAALYGVTVTEIVELNGGQNALKPGMILHIPNSITGL